MGKDIMSWKYFYSSVKGTSHIAANTPKQDSCKICMLDDYLISAVADGAGSAKHSDLSSRFICKLFVKKTKQWLANNKIEDLTREIIAEWFTHFQKVINRAVLVYNLESSREFATTLLFSVLSKNFNIFVQIGDGIIAVGDAGDMECVFLPQNGEFINTTNFATETNAVNIFMYKTFSKTIRCIAIHTDGIEQIALDFKAQKPFIPFFIPFFSALEKVKNSGYSETLSKQLEIFLQSDRVNKKTDDDKTLFLATVIAHNMEAENE